MSVVCPLTPFLNFGYFCCGEVMSGLERCDDFPFRLLKLSRLSVEQLLEFYVVFCCLRTELVSFFFSRFIMLFCFLVDRRLHCELLFMVGWRDLSRFGGQHRVGCVLGLCGHIHMVGSRGWKAERVCLPGFFESLLKLGFPKPTTILWPSWPVCALVCCWLS